VCGHVGESDCLHRESNTGEGKVSSLPNPSTLTPVCV